MTEENTIDEMAQEPVIEDVSSGTEIEAGSEESNALPDESANDEQTQEVDAQPSEQTQEEQDAIQKAINKKHFEKMQAQRERDAALQELERIRAENAQQQQKVEIPPVPDPFDENYGEKLAAREQAIQEKARIEYAEKQQLEQQQNYYLQMQQKKQIEQAEAMNKCYENAQKNGISQDDLNFAAQQLAAGNINAQVAENIVKDDDSALLISYLGGNAQEIDIISQLDPFGAAMYIERNIRPKIRKPKTVSAAKAPPKVVKGGSVESDRSKYPFSAGATFE